MKKKYTVEWLDSVGDSHETTFLNYRAALQFSAILDIHHLAYVWHWPEDADAMPKKKED